MQNLNKANKQVKEYFFVTVQREKERLKKQGREIADLSMGNPDMFPPPEVMETLRQNCLESSVHGYQPNTGSFQIKESMISWYKRFFNVNLDNNEVIPLQGSRQGILQISQTVLQEGDKVLVPDPGYPSYTFAAKMMGATAIPYALKSENDYLPDIEKIENMNLSGVKILWINYPHMPTGAKANKEMFEKIVKFARKNKILIINDHAYSFVQNDKPVSILSVEGAKDVGLELNSLSKNYNLAGWRLGFLAGNAEVISDLLQLKSHLNSGIALPLQYMAASALDLEQKWFDFLNDEYTQRRKFAEQLAGNLDCELVGGPAGMFIWVKMPGTKISSREFVEYMLQEVGVLVAPGSLFGENGENHLRISLCADVNEIKKGIDNINNSQVLKHKFN